VLFLGAFDPSRHLADLSMNIAAMGQFTSRKNEIFHYFDNITPPQVLPPSQNAELLIRAKAFVGASMPHVHAEVQSAVYTKASFGTGRTLAGQRVCGGYFKENIMERGGAR
jgi:hypothetical protein